MDDADKYVLRQAIAAALDYPSVYMGGPSPHSIQRAIRIINAIISEYDITPNDQRLADAARVREWRTSSWDSLNHS